MEFLNFHLIDWIILILLLITSLIGFNNGFIQEFLNFFIWTLSILISFLLINKLIIFNLINPNFIFLIIIFFVLFLLSFIILKLTIYFLKQLMKAMEIFISQLLKKFYKFILFQQMAYH